MVNTQYIVDAIESSGLKKSFISNKLGITSNSLRNKVNNRTPFKKSEILVLSSLLAISEEDRDNIFFAEKVGV